LLESPIGDDGLKVEGARHAVSLLNSIPIGSEKGVVIVGPMDLANYKASDVLLKCIEEFDDEHLQPILWAHDFGGVSETIRSRCLDFWAPLDDVDGEDDDFLVSAGWDLLNAVLNDDLWQIPGVLDRFKGKKGWEHDLLAYLVEALSQDLLTSDDPEPRLKLWRRLREAARHRNPTSIEIIAALLHHE